MSCNKKLLEKAMWQILITILVYCLSSTSSMPAAADTPQNPPPAPPVSQTPPSPPPGSPSLPSGPPPLPPGPPSRPQNPQPIVQDLGNQHYRIGAIELDKAQGSFTVPGVVIRLNPPLEFLAVAKGGMKNYESLLELDANAFEFNLACILIGLDSQKAKLPRFHFDPEPTQGDRVEVRIGWQAEGKTVEVNAAELFKEGDKPVTSQDWVYTGSGFLPDGRYLAALTGSLLSFVHDPESVIQHRQGIGLNHYGSVSVNSAVAPPVGTRISLTVRRLD